MRKTFVIARTAPLAPTAVLLSRLGAEGVEDGLRLRAFVDSSSEGSRWRVRRYVYRLAGADAPASVILEIKLVSNGRVVHAFEAPGIAGDGRWYVHEHTTLVAKDACTYARFEAVVGSPGPMRRALGELRGRRADRDPGAGVGPGAGHAEDVERAA